MSARETALKILYRINEERAYSNIAFDKELALASMTDRRDVALTTELVNGTIKNMLYLDLILSQLSKQRLSKLSPWVRNILRMSLYQIIFLDKIPESAAVNEGVNLTKKYSNPGSVKFVNAILRNYIRQRDTLSLPSREDDPIEYLSIIYSFPKWLVEHYVGQYGFEDTEKMLEFFNQPPQLWIRVNTNLISLEEATAFFLENKIEAQESRFIPEAFLQKSGLPLTKTEEYQKGFFSYQDETSMFAVDILGVQPGQKVADLCSAPGGKSLFMAQRMQDKGEILALELHQHRLKLLEEASRRQGNTIIKAQEGDAREISKEYDGYFDAVLLDVPCSGLGVVGKRPDLKYQASPDKFTEITQLQKELLEAGARILKEGGSLLYSTCTLNELENRHIINNFLEENKNFERLPLPEKYKEFADQDGNLQTLPFRDHKSGFFISKLRKRSLT